MENKAKRGFAALDSATQRELSRRGGKAAHERGKAHEFTQGEAREAGRLGGLKISQDREYMSHIGRKGGRASALRRGQAEARPNPEQAAEAPGSEPAPGVTG